LEERRNDLRRFWETSLKARVKEVIPFFPSLQANVNVPHLSGSLGFLFGYDQASFKNLDEEIKRYWELWQETGNYEDSLHQAFAGC